MIENPKRSGKETKLSLFEFLVFLLVKWAKELRPAEDVDLSKLRLQKILFFASTIDSQNDNHPLLDVFNRFYALPYGPVEVDIYDAMNDDSFTSISFVGNSCIYDNLMSKDFSTLPNDLKSAMENAVLSLKKVGFDYLFSSVFDLVDITHKWTVWEVSMKYAEIMGRHREEMTTESICDSKVKAYS